VGGDFHRRHQILRNRHVFKFRGYYSGTDKAYEGTLVIPMRCAVCDGEEAELFTYDQGHFPIPIPGFGGVYRRTTATIPYCSRHLAAFHTRFRILTFLQYAVIGIGFPFMYWGLILTDENHGGNEGWNWQLSIGVICFCILLPASLIVRGKLYDAFFRVRPDGIEIRSNYRQFIKNLYEANCVPVDDNAFGQGLTNT
jgi:hypothetical protein